MKLTQQRTGTHKANEKLRYRSAREHDSINLSTDEFVQSTKGDRVRQSSTLLDSKSGSLQRVQDLAEVVMPRKYQYERFLVIQQNR